MKLTISFAVLCLAYTISTFKGPDVADAKPLVPKSQRSSTDMKRSEGSSESSSEDSSGFDRCSTDPCMNMGTCFDGTDNYRCICTDGFKGQNCEEFDSCSTDPCQNNGTCIDGADNYTCICADGFKGPSCEDSEPCQPGLVFILDSCYYFSQTDATWYDAREACIGLGGYLVAMETDDEYLSLTKYGKGHILILLFCSLQGKHIVAASSICLPSIFFPEYPSTSTGWNLAKLNMKCNY
ncbi:versican core protein-like [Mercenaria mercenaria]|uniref:versican core protein-like n=1 Tax=Mercenaria mercenaria TaxID=6596 RepID=UPI00234E7260|nr:versican core protein-like [Mercenaria mercenaria]